MTVTLSPPWLTFDFAVPHRVVSFAPCNGGLVTASRIIWRQVWDADLTAGFDAKGWLAAEMAGRGEAGAVGMLTSRDLAHHRWESVAVGGARAECLTTVGLGNAERVGHRRAVAPGGYGTINLAVRLSPGPSGAGLTDAALIEAISIVAQARTAAVIGAGPMLPAGPATGTGTDCIAVAALPGTVAHTGLHTEIGEALGRAVYLAVRAGVQAWMREHGWQTAV